MCEKTDFMYRFRAMKYLLGEEYEELAKQEIYFSPFGQLNDPMEGFLNISWEGDSIVWGNFFKKYFTTLYWSIEGALLGDEGDDLKKFLTTRFNSESLVFLKQDELDELAKEFCKKEFMQTLCNFLSSSDQKISSEELIFFCRLIHFDAIRVIYGRLTLEKHISEEHYGNVLKILDKVVSKDISVALEALAKGKSEHSSFGEVACRFMKNMQTQQLLIVQCESEKERKVENFIFFGFTDCFLKSLHELVYPSGLVACFLKKVSNPSLWGYYGDAHYGAALKFKVKEQDNKFSLPLRTRIGCSGGRDRKITYQYGIVPHTFYQVRYRERYPEVNFFERLGNIPMPEIERWHHNDFGECSSCREGMGDMEQWRSSYWREYYEICTTKLEGWKHEEEYRLIKNETNFSYEDVRDRKLQYEFADLEGIVFGINVLEEDKIKLIKLIKSKCQREKRTDFKFYQARYDEQSGLIKYDELTQLTRFVSR